MLVDQGELVGEYRWLIRPPENEYLRFNISLHGIGPEDTAGAPDFPEVWSRALGLIGDRVTVAHYAGFDCSVARHSAAHWGYTFAEMPFACTYRLAKLTWSDRSTYRLSELASDLGIELEHHDPLSDARAAAQLAMHMCTHYQATSIVDLARRAGMRLGTLSLTGPLFKSSGSSLTQMSATVDPVDEEHPLYDKRVAFTGTLDSMTRAEAVQAVHNVGGMDTGSVSKKLDYLVMGWTDFSRVGNDGMSSKLRKARAIAEDGYSLEIIDEVEFFRLLDP